MGGVQKITRFKTLNYLLAIGLLVVSLKMVSYIGNINLYSLEFGTSIFTYYLSAFCGSISVCLFFVNMQRQNTKIITLSSGTIVILCSHMIFVLLSKICYKLLFHISTPPPYMDSISACIISASILLLLYFPIHYLLNNDRFFCRFLIGKYK